MENMVKYDFPFAKAYLDFTDKKFALDAVNNGWGKMQTII